MATVRCLEDLRVWQEARLLVKEVYRVSNKGPFSRDFPLREQIRKAALSIMSNIAEGFERNGNKEFFQFLSIAKGSLGEVKSQIYAAYDQEYIDPETFKRLLHVLSETGKMVNGLMRYLDRSGMKGSKYRKEDTKTRRHDECRLESGPRKTRAVLTDLTLNDEP